MKKIYKSKFAKATIIPALCAVASVLPQKSDANWAAGIGYLVAGLFTGAGTSVVANSTTPTTTVTQQPQYYIQGQPQQTYVAHPQQAYVPAQPQQSYYVPAAQPTYGTKTVECIDETDVRTVKRVIRRRIIRTTTQQGYQQPVIEEIIEEVPVATQQSAPRYNPNQGRNY